MIIFADIKWSSGLTYLEGWTENVGEKVNAITERTITGMMNVKNKFGDRIRIC